MLSKSLRSNLFLFLLALPFGLALTGCGKSECVKNCEARQNCPNTSKDGKSCEDACNQIEQVNQQMGCESAFDKVETCESANQSCDSCQAEGLEYLVCLVANKCTAMIAASDNGAMTPACPASGCKSGTAETWSVKVTKGDASSCGSVSAQVTCPSTGSQTVPLTKDASGFSGSGKVQCTADEMCTYSIALGTNMPITGSFECTP
jgi:hypothetical protein